MGNESYNLYYVFMEDKLYIMYGKFVIWNKNMLIYGCVYFIYDYIVIWIVIFLGFGILNIISVIIFVFEK